MKKNYKIVLGAVLAGLSLCAVACTNSKTKAVKDRLYIVYYPGGYGREYLETFTREFVAQYKGKSVDQVKENVDYYLRPDQNCVYGTTGYLTLKDKAPDIIIGGVPSGEAISQGFIEPITDLMNEKVTVNVGGEEQEVAIKDYYLPESTEQFHQQFIYGKGSKEYWALPYSQIPLSLVYNEDILLKTPHLEENGEVKASLLDNGKWILPPETYTELVAYFKDIESTNSGKSASDRITPFAWCSSNANWFQAFYIQWWAETQGLYTSKKPGEGSFYDFWNLESPDVWKQTGIQEAFQKVKDLIYDNNGNFQFTYTDKDPTVISGTLCQADFASGNAAICLTGDFFEKEYQTQIQESGQTFKFMRLPSINGNAGLTDQDGNAITKTLHANIEASAYIPYNSPNKDMAKGFLKYISQEKQIVRFTEMTGCLKPTTTNVKEISTKTDWTTFQQSVLDTFYDSDEIIYKFPKTKTEDISPIYVHESSLRTSFFPELEYPVSITRLKTYTPYEILIKYPANTFTSVYDAAVKLYTNTTAGYNKVYRSWIDRQ